MSIPLYTLRVKRFYVFLVVFAPLWIVAPVLLQMYFGYPVLAVILGLILLTVTGLVAQKIARKQIDLTIENNTVSFDEITLEIENIRHIKIDRSGIGTSSIEFHSKTGEKTVLNLTNLKGNANKAIAFVEKNLPEIEQIGPEDLLG